MTPSVFGGARGFAVENALQWGRNFHGHVIDLSLAFLAAAKAGSVRMAGTSLVHSPHAWPQTDCKPTCA